MVSMVIVLFLVAVVISLFLGRLAESLTNRLRKRSQPRLAGEPGSPDVAGAHGNRAA
jgi:hypothetical protein